MRALVAIVVLAALGVLAGCYNPRLGEGDFLCGPQGACPAGWKCGPDSRCYHNVSNFDANPPDTVIPPDLKVDTPVTPPVDGGVCQRGLTCSAGAPTGAACDLVCQTGCGCADRCTISASSVLCRPITTPRPTALGDKCSPDNDTCGAGAICAPEARFDACGAHCYRACRVDADCGPSSRCTEGLVTPQDVLLTKFCGPAIEQCNPVGGGTRPACLDQTRRAAPNFACYLLDAGKEDAAVCDCAGTLELGAACQLKRQCAPGLECLPAGPTGDLRCRQLCSLALGPLACALPAVCRALGTSTRFGVCL